MQPPLANVFQPLISVFDAILKFFHDDVGLGWGLAIIARTVLIRFLLLPLTLKQLPVFLSLYYMLRTDLRYDICPGINPPGTSNPQPCGETAAHFLFIPDL